jgi:DNA (cytosine-5)-methyltransferase 1
LNELALFAGAGGGLLATKHLLGWRTVCYVENKEYPVEVLKARIRDGLLDDAPIWGDARTFDGRPWRGCVDIVTAGFPCQPFSIAGKKLAGDDDRNLWPETIRVIREVRPLAVFLENVSGIVSSGYILTVLDDLAKSGYKTFPPVRLAASNVGANHRRRRIWIVSFRDDDVAHANQGLSQGTSKKVRTGRVVAELCSQDVAHTQGAGAQPIQQPRQGNGSFEGCEDVADSAEPRLERAARQGESETGRANVELADRGRNVAHSAIEGGGGLPIRQGRQEQEAFDADGRCEVVADTESVRCKQVVQPVAPRAIGQGATSTIVHSSVASRGVGWAVEPGLGRVAHGVAHRVDRLKAIGNGQVPAVAATAWRLLSGNH